MSNQLTNGIHVKRFHFASNVFTTLLNLLPCNECFSVSSWKSKKRFRFQSGILLSCQSRWDGINKRLLSDHGREFLKMTKAGDSSQKQRKEIPHRGNSREFMARNSSKDHCRDFFIEATVENSSEWPCQRIPQWSQKRIPQNNKNSFHSNRLLWWR